MEHFFILSCKTKSARQDIDPELNDAWCGFWATRAFVAALAAAKSTKHKAGKLAEQLTKSGIKSDSLHGDKSQSARQKALDLFKSGKVSVLVATDIASRGIDVDDVTHVINYELPMVPEDYVHRIGRTARAGASGSALSLCDKSEIPHLTKIEQLIKTKIEILEGERPQSESPERSGKISKKKRKKRKKSFKKIVNF